MLQKLALTLDRDRYLNKFEGKKKKPAHHKAVIVDEIIKVVGKSETYNYRFWLRKLKDFETKGGSLSLIHGWLKEINTYPDTFNKGGTLTNKLVKYGRKEISGDVSSTSQVHGEKGGQGMEKVLVQT